MDMDDDDQEGRVKKSVIKLAHSQSSSKSFTSPKRQSLKGKNDAEQRIRTKRRKI